MNASRHSVEIDVYEIRIYSLGPYGSAEMLRHDDRPLDTDEIDAWLHKEGFRRTEVLKLYRSLDGLTLAAELEALV